MTSRVSMGPIDQAWVLTILPVLPSLSRFCENACKKLPRPADAEPEGLPSELVRT